MSSWLYSQSNVSYRLWKRKSVWRTSQQASLEGVAHIMICLKDPASRECNGSFETQGTERRDCIWDAKILRYRGSIWGGVTLNHTTCSIDSLANGP